MSSSFVKRETKLTYFTEKAIKDEIKKRDLELNHEVFNVRDLTQCPRRLMYRINGEVTAQTKCLKDLQLQFSKKKWVDFFEKAKDIKIIDRDVVLADANYNIATVADAIFKCHNYVSVLMVDALGSEDYIKAQRVGGLRLQVLALMTTIWLAELDNGVLLCENKNTNEYFLSHVILNERIIESIKKKFQKLLEQKILQKLPSRPYDDSGSPECLGCEYRGNCWKT